MKHYPSLSRSRSGERSERQRLFEFLKTPSLASRQASLGLKIIEDDLEWTELYSGNFTSHSPSRYGILLYSGNFSLKKNFKKREEF